MSAQNGRPTTTGYFRVFGEGGFFTIEPQNIKAILATQFKDFGLGDRRNGNFAPLLGRGIFSSDGDEWLHARNLLRPQFARDLVSDLDLEEEHVRNMMRAIPADSSGWTDVIDLEPIFFRLTIDSATEFLFGQSVDSQLSSLPDYVASKGSLDVKEQDFAMSFDKAQQCIATASRMGEFYWIVYDKAFKENCKRCHDFIDKYVELALSKEKVGIPSNPQEKQKYCFLDALVESTRDPIELRSHMLSILLAGRDTTASLLSYVFMTFTQQPDIFEKLRAIILENFGTYNNPKNLSFSNLKACSYLQWVLHETLRLYPVVPVDGRRALRDTTIPTGGGPDGTEPLYVRKGQQVDYSVYAMHRRKDLWGADAEDFRPERWEARKSGWEYLPFNGGPRICIGQQFALTEAGYVMVRLLQRFEKIEPLGNVWESKERGGEGVIKHALTLTMCPYGGVNVRMKEAAA